MRADMCVRIREIRIVLETFARLMTRKKMHACCSFEKHTHMSRHARSEREWIRDDVMTDVADAYHARDTIRKCEVPRHENGGQEAAV